MTGIGIGDYKRLRKVKYKFFIKLFQDKSRMLIIRIFS